MAYSSQSPQSGGMLPPLSIGNVVSTAFRLYSSHLKSYLTQALIGTLWVLVPIYGWAKYSAKSALISRLAFGELINEPESVGSADQHTSQRMWSFLGVYFGVAIRLFAVYLGLALAGGIVVGVLAAMSGGNPAVIGVLMTMLVIGIILLITWFYSRLIIADVPLAVEDTTTAKQSLDRSWSLTKDSVFRIQGVVLVAFLITLPILFLSNYLPSIFLFMVKENSSLYWTIYSISIFTSLIGNLFVIPFWQAIKAVLYYDLRSRREGLDLRLRDH
jgi:hypothetical protein